VSESLILNLSDRRAKQSLMAHLAGLQGEWRIELCRYRARRTDAQNRFYHPCLCKPLADFLTEQGQPTTMEEAHEILKHKFLRVSVVHPETGEFIGERTRSTTTLDVAEFSEYIEQCMAWLADTFGIVCPDPMTFGMEVPAQIPQHAEPN
jgi:hypothetical protein